ncbi:MAG TPA: acyl-CoA dehydrogenase family protein [Pseudomonadales bacterium]
MNFDLDEQQTALQNTVADCLAQQLDTPRLLAVVNGDDGHDAALWRTLGELGVFGVTVPEAWGGTGLGLLEAALIAEVLGSRAAPGPFLGQVLTALAIAEGGTDAQRERWLPRLARGEAIATLVLGEPAERWQPDEWTLPAADRLAGRKTHVLYPWLADVMLVGTAGGGLMLVANGEGIDVERIPCLDPTRRLGHVTFTGAPAEPLAFDGARLRDAALVLLAADAFGGARRCVDMAVEYALGREQFGTVIGRFQAVKHQLANMATDVEPAQGLYWYAAHAFDAVAEDAARMAALAKAHIAERFLQAARGATEAHGGIGYTWEYPLHVWVKRAVFDRAYLGSPTIHRRRSARLAGWTSAA